MPFHGSLFFWGSCCRFIRFIDAIYAAGRHTVDGIDDSDDESDETAATAPKEKRAMKRHLL